jgi:16S rRNA pseudouridine516 synthase
VAGAVRLERFLANLGYGSRKYVSSVVKAGEFECNGVVFKDPSLRVNPDELRNATFEGEPLDPISPLTILLNKPRGYTCSTDEDGDLVYDLLPPRWKMRDPILSTAGRLDKDSTGLVLMTDDGQLLHKVISPKIHVQKHYLVTLRDDLRGDEAVLFATGEFCLSNDNKPLKPAIWTPDGPRSGAMILQEGRYHQIRRMFSTINNHVETLHRFQLGGLDLFDLEEGEHKVLSDTEIALIFSGK